MLGLRAPKGQERGPLTPYNREGGHELHAVLVELEAEWPVQDGAHQAPLGRAEPWEGKQGSGGVTRPAPPPTAPGSAIAQLGASSCPDFTGLLNTESDRNTSYKLGGFTSIQIAALAEKKSNLVTLGPLPMRQGLLGSTGLLSPSGAPSFSPRSRPLHPASPPSSAPLSPLAGDPSVSVWPSASHLSHVTARTWGPTKAGPAKMRSRREECVPPVGLWEVGRWALEQDRLQHWGRSPPGGYVGVRPRTALRRPDQKP